MNDENYCWANEMLKTLVFEYRVVSFEYFMEELSIFQAWKCLENTSFTDFTQRILIRYAIWSLYNSNAFAKNNMQVEDILPLPWDEEKNNKNVTEAQVRDAESIAKSIEEMMKSGKVKTEKYMG